jgi:hypothetical protein
MQSHSLADAACRRWLRLIISDYAITLTGIVPLDGIQAAQGLRHS